jgi:hypothetical protein
MALSKLIQTGYGIDCNYHKITEVKVDWLRKIASCKLESFLTQDARNAGKMAVISHDYVWSGEQFDFITTDDLVGKMYGKIKLYDAWADSINV